MATFTNPHPQFQSFYSSFHHQNPHFPHHPSSIHIDFQPHDISTNESNPFRSFLLRHEKLCQSFGRSLSTQEILQIEFHFGDSVVNNYWYCEQDSTMSNYFQEFVDWKRWAAIYFDEEDSEEVVVGIFIRGLTEPIRNRMPSSSPTSLNRAYWDAIFVELSLKLSSQISTAMKTLFDKFPQRSMVVVQESKDEDEVPNLVEPTVQHEEKHPSQGDLVVDRREADTSPQIGELVTKKNPGIQDPEKLKRDEDIKVRDCKFDIKVISDFTKDASLLQKYMFDFGSPTVLVIDSVIMDLENYDEVFSLQDFSYVDEVHCINVGLQDCMVYYPGGQRHGGATHLISSIDNRMWCNGRNCCMIWSALDSLLQSGMVISYFDDKISSIGQRKYAWHSDLVSCNFANKRLILQDFNLANEDLRNQFRFSSHNRALQYITTSFLQDIDIPAKLLESKRCWIYILLSQVRVYDPGGQWSLVCCLAEWYTRQRCSDEILFSSITDSIDINLARGIVWVNLIHTFRFKEVLNGLMLCCTRNHENFGHKDFRSLIAKHTSHLGGEVVGKGRSNSIVIQLWKDKEDKLIKYDGDSEYVPCSLIRLVFILVCHMDGGLGVCGELRHKQVYVVCHLWPSGIARSSLTTELTIFSELWDTFPWDNKLFNVENMSSHGNGFHYRIVDPILFFKENFSQNIIYSWLPSTGTSTNQSND